MASKLQAYAQMADYTAQQITGSYQKWTAFLDTVGRLYKYPFPEQLLIHAQRPNATACAEYDTWKDHVGRYVRRGAVGIAIIDNSGSKPFLRYVFDVDDTGGGPETRPRLWEYGDEHTGVVSAALEQRFEISASNGSLAGQLEQVASQLAAEYWDEHQRDILDIVDGSFLGEYDAHSIGTQFQNAATVSMAYALMSRCGLKPESYFTHEDFLSVFDFNTPDTLEDIDPTAIREHLEQAGDKPSAFVEQVIADVERIAEQEADAAVTAPPTVREIYDHYKPMVKELVLADAAYQNACKNSDKENAIFEGDAAVKRAALTIQDAPFMRLYHDMADFRYRMHREIIDETYATLSQPQQEQAPDLSGQPITRDPLAPAYQPGDTVYLDKTAYEIYGIGIFDVDLQDPTQAYPVLRSEPIERFETLLWQDSRNSPITEFMPAKLERVHDYFREALTSGLLTDRDKEQISNWLRSGQGNTQIGERLAEQFADRAETMQLITGETADYFTSTTGMEVKVHDKFSSGQYMGWALIPSILRAVCSFAVLCERAGYIHFQRQWVLQAA